MSSNLEMSRETGRESLGMDSLLIAEFKPCRSILQEAITTAVDRYGADMGKVWLYDGQYLSVVTVVNVPERVIDGFTLQPGQGLTGRCVVSKSPVSTVDIQSDPRTARPDIAFNERAKGFAAVPIQLGSRLIGALNLSNTTPRDFSEYELRSLSLYAKAIGLAVHDCLFFPDLLPEWVEQFREYGRYGKPVPLAKPAKAPETVGLPAGKAALPKGINEPTLETVFRCIKNASRPLSTKEISRTLQISQVTIRRYVAFLCTEGVVTRQVSYGPVGRPRYLYSA